ncbi:TetR/AcrR family transcriptional regulator [Amycolatopsis sp. lyj-109]|uniref:TetR/AcrR family transcriptional regulator n=1 Tax=Amycolatopsis sp. lyj-109 TaxID=2789287 RepID=UPI00397C3DC9
MRADAAGNVERILRAAREVFADLGPDAPLTDIARRADVGIRTLYRHFPNKGDLVRAALEQGFAEELGPTIKQALSDDDPRNGLRVVMETTLSMMVRERNTLAAAKDSGALTAEVAVPFLDSLTLLASRGQQAGLIRDDLVPGDLHRIMGMLSGVLWSMDPEEDSWRRYVALILDALSPVGASPLPAAWPLDEAPRPCSWTS